MKEELEAIERNKIWELVVLPRIKKTISVRLRCVFKINLKPFGSVAKHSVWFILL